MQQTKRPVDRRSPRDPEYLKMIWERLKTTKLNVSAVVPLTFVLLLIFKLIDLIILNKTVENILLIPFQATIFLLPAFMFACLKDQKNPLGYLLSLRIVTPKVHHIPLILSSIGLMLVGTMLASLIFAGTDSMESGFSLYSTFVSRVGGGFFPSLFLIIAYCAVPAVCEELVFRGILCREYEKLSVPVGIFSSAVFFACLHFDLGQFPVYLFSGILLALTMYASGSLIVSAIVHFVFNLIGLFGQSYLNAFYHVTGGRSGTFTFVLAMLTLLFAALFCLFASKCYARRALRSTMPSRPIFPGFRRLTAVFSGIFINPFIIFSFALYIIVAVIIPLFR